MNKNKKAISNFKLLHLPRLLFLHALLCLLCAWEQDLYNGLRCVNGLGSGLCCTFKSPLINLGYMECFPSFLGLCHRLEIPVKSPSNLPTCCSQARHQPQTTGVTGSSFHLSMWTKTPLTGNASGKGNSLWRQLQSCWFPWHLKSLGGGERWEQPWPRKPLFLSKS